MSQPLQILANTGAQSAVSGTPYAPGIGPGLVRGTYRTLYTVAVSGTLTAQTALIIPGVVPAPGVVSNVWANWTEANAANTTKTTVNILKAENGTADGGTTIFGTNGTITNNQTAQNTSNVAVVGAPAFNAGSANINPIFTGATSTGNVKGVSGVNVGAGAKFYLTTVATSTQGKDFSCTVEVTHNLGDDAASTGLI